MLRHGITMLRCEFPMADETAASVIPLHQVAPKKISKAAERARAYRQRRKKLAATGTAPPSSDHLIPLDFQSVDQDNSPPVPVATSEPVSVATPPAPHPAPTVMVQAASPRRQI